MLTENELRQVLDKAVSTGGDFAELYWRTRKSITSTSPAGNPAG